MAAVHAGGEASYVHGVQVVGEEKDFKYVG